MTDKILADCYVKKFRGSSAENREWRDHKAVASNIQCG